MLLAAPKVLQRGRIIDRAPPVVVITGVNRGQGRAFSAELDSFAECDNTIVASMSSTNPAGTRPRTVVAGNERRVSSNRKQAGSRAADRAARNRAGATVSTLLRTRRAL